MRMTWSEWVDSSYNTVNATITDAGYVNVPCSDDETNSISITASQRGEHLILPGAVYEILHK